MSEDPMVNECFDENEELSVTDYKRMLDNCQEHVSVLEVRIKELKEKLNNEWKDISEYKPSYGPVLLHNINGEGSWVDFRGVNEAYFLTPAGNKGEPTHFKLITPPTPQEGGKE